MTQCDSFLTIDDNDIIRNGKERSKEQTKQWIKGTTLNNKPQN